METKEDNDNVYTVLFDYKAQEADELTLIKGCKIKLISTTGEDGWWYGCIGNKNGMFPSNYVTKLVKEKCDDNVNDVIKIEKVKSLRTVSNSSSNKTNSTTIASSAINANTGSSLNQVRQNSDSKKYESKNEKINEIVKIDEIPKYKLNELGSRLFIGSGGFSKVYKGIDLKTNKEVAIKELTISRDNDKMLLEFYQEAKLCWHLKHPYIIKLYGICVESPHNFLIMEYAKGGSLRRLLGARKNGLPPLTLIQWALQVAYGMQYLHEEAGIPIIHRDLKSSNILLSDEVTDYNLDDIILKLSDFGLARETLNNGDNIMTIAGTSRWMSPEVLKSGIYSKASDVWSFGVLLWELLTGEIPFQNFDYDPRIVYGIVEGHLRLPIPSTCPEIFSNLLQSCWRDDPNDRYTMKQIIEALIEISNSDFAETPCDSFKMLQEDLWKPEINQMFEEMCVEIQQREKELYAKAEELARRHDELEQRAKELEEREKLLIVRELSIALRHCVAPEPKKRHFLKKPFHLFRSHDKKIDIGPPSDFTHCITVQSEGQLNKQLSNNNNNNDDNINNNNQIINIMGSNNNISPTGQLFNNLALSSSSYTNNHVNIIDNNTSSSTNTTNNNNNNNILIPTPTLPLGNASPSLRLRVFLPSQNNDILNGNPINNYQKQRDKSLSNDNSSEVGSAASTPKHSRHNRHTSRPKTPKQTTIWYQNDLRSNSLDSDTVFTEKLVDTNLTVTNNNNNNININHYGTLTSDRCIHSAYSVPNNKKINKIFYEIGSFLGLVGLGKDYKKEIAGNAKPPICSTNKIRKSSSPNTLQRSNNNIKYDKNVLHSRDLTPPGSLTRVNKTYPYRLKSSSKQKIKSNNEQHDCDGNYKSKSNSDSNNSGTSSLQSSPKICNYKSNIVTSPLNRAKIEQSRTSLFTSVSASTLQTPLDHNYTDDSGIYGETRQNMVTNSNISKVITSVIDATTNNNLIKKNSNNNNNNSNNSLIRPGSLNLKTALEKSNVFQKRKDLLTSSNSTEDDEHNYSFNDNGSVLSQLVNASNVMRDQIGVLLSSSVESQESKHKNKHKQLQQKKSSNNSTPSTTNTKFDTPSDDFVFNNFDLSSDSKTKNNNKIINKQLTNILTPNTTPPYIRTSNSYPGNDNSNDDDDNMQSTLL